MTKEEQLSWEARAGRSAAAAAFASAVLLLASRIYLPARLGDTGEGARGSLIAIDSHQADVIVAGVLQAVAYLLLVAVIVYLYRVTKFRRQELPSVALVLGIAGPILAGAAVVATQLMLIDVAGDFTASGPRTEDRADDLLREGDIGTLRLIGLAPNLAVGFALVLINVNAMRAGVLSRFMGILGIVIGALYVLPLLDLSVVQLFWLLALGVLFLGRWPGGRGPAWERGEAVPWPSAAEQREAAAGASSGDDREGASTGDGRESASNGEGPAGASAGAGGGTAAGARRRKRKRRR